jgi:hypothetical protein
MTSKQSRRGNQRDNASHSPPHLKLALSSMLRIIHLKKKNQTGINKQEISVIIINFPVNFRRLSNYVFPKRVPAKH